MVACDGTDAAVLHVLPSAADRFQGGKDRADYFRPPLMGIGRFPIGVVASRRSPRLPMPGGPRTPKQNQPDTGTVPSGDRQLGHTMVLYPGHPLVGRIVSVVRRYRQREQGQWIIELPDGSRQYVPISWCSPLSSEGPPTVPASSQDEPSSEGAAPSPLSLEGLRNLAALVRRLQKEAAQRGEEQQDAGPGAREDAAQEPAPRRECEADVATLGELLGGGPAPSGLHDPPGSAPPGGAATGDQPPAQVREP
jgi:hypothetical protein